jgi:AmmeMemoRadiSam system protein B
MAVLPSLRAGLDFMPSPLEDRPGLLVRDPLLYGEQAMVIPPPLVPALVLFDGRHTEEDLVAILRRITGEDDVSALRDHLMTSLREAAFLEDETFARRQESRHRAFASSPTRLPAHAGGAYPEGERDLRDLLGRYLSGDGAPPLAPVLPGVHAIAAPHVSPEGGFRSYAAAYQALAAAPGATTALILGTSHYGQPGRFGLTRKPYVTPLGSAEPDRALVEELHENGGSAVVAEDYCHAVEHSIEFQVVFLQQVLGPKLRIVPVLCGAFLDTGGLPEDDQAVGRFFEALRGMLARERDRVLVVLGIDMAHVGRRYGDSMRARADRGPLQNVGVRDKERIALAMAGDASGFWDDVRGTTGTGDDLKWCGASPLYTFLRTAGPVKGELLRYEQWNIDEASVVSFAALAWSRASGL